MLLRCTKWMAVAAMASSLAGCSVPVIGWRPMVLPGFFRSHAIPDRYPLGSIERAHFQNMQTNGEATDFIMNQIDFVGDTAELTPDGKDHILEIAARMRSAPFPVLVERSENNSNPQLDAERRGTVSMILADLGNPDADQRTFVSPPYGPGITSMEGNMDYNRFIFSRGAMGNWNNGWNNGFGGGYGNGWGFGR